MGLERRAPIEEGLASPRTSQTTRGAKRRRGTRGSLTSEENERALSFPSTPPRVAIKFRRMQSLRDKLLQAGVVTAEQAAQNEQKVEAERRARKERAHAKPRVNPVPPPAPVRVESDKDRERRQNRELADRQKAIRALCDAKEVSERGDQSFFYRTRKRELRRMYLLPAQVEALQQGELAIVDRPNGNDRPHALVPRAIAEQILGLESKAIRFWARSPTESYGFEDEPASAEEQSQAREGTVADNAESSAEAPTADATKPQA
jgi:uncharacterized protein YaiL (DUF2058 family)